MWQLKSLPRARFKHGRREIMVEWKDGLTWKPDSDFDEDVSHELNRKFTKSRNSLELGN